MPGVPTKEIEIAFDGGIDQFTEERHLQPPGLIDCVNLVPYSNGSLRRRNGSDIVTATATTRTSTPYSHSGTITDWRNACRYKDSVIAYDGAWVYTYDNSYPTSSVVGWTAVDKVPPVMARRSNLTATTQTVDTYDLGWVASTTVQSGSKGYLVTAWNCYDPTTIGTTEYLQVFVTVKDITTGAIICDKYKLSSGATTNYYDVRVTTTYGGCVMVTYRTNAGALYGRVMLSSQVNFWGAETNIATLGVGGIFAYDLTGDDSAQQFYLVYETAIAGNLLGAKRITVALGVPNIAQSVTYADPGGITSLRGVGITQRASGAKVYLIAIWDTGTPSGDIYVKSISASNLATVNWTNTCNATLQLTAGYYYSRIGACILDSDNIFIVFSEDIAEASNTAIRSLYWLGFNTTTPAVYTYYGSIASGVLTGKPFVYSSKPYFQMVYRQGGNATTEYLHAATVLVDPLVTEESAVASGYGLPAATVAPRITSFSGASNQVACHIVGTSESDVFYGALLVGDLGSLSTGESYISSVMYDFRRSNNCMKGVTLGDTLYFAAGTPLFYDGSLCQEIGFLTVPVIGSVATNGGFAGTWLSATTYQITAAYEAVDNCGDKHYSSTLLPYSSFTPSVNLKSTDFNNVYFDGITRRQRKSLSNANKFGVGLYATLSTTGSVFYRFAIKNPNVPSSKSFSYTEGDPAVVTDPILYTTGGGLDAVCPPCLTDITVHKNRIWGIGDDERTVWFSSQKRERFAPFFNEVFTFRVDDDGLPLTAIASLDENLILFKNNKIYVVSGDGPNENGTGSTLSSPQFVNTDVGCDNPRSVARIPNGLIFSGAGSIYVLSRGLTLSNIGKRVQALLATWPIITSVAVCSKSNQVRFSCSNAETAAAGIILVYDYELDRWFTNKYYPRSSNETTITTATTVDSSGRQWLFFYDGKCFRENLGTYKDVGATLEVPDAYVQTAHLQAAGKNGFMRVQKIGLMYSQLSSDHNIRFDLKQNFGVSFQQNKTFTAATITALNQETIQLHPVKSECQSISVKVSMQIGASPSTCQGLNFIGLVFTVGSEGGQFRVAPSAQA